MLRVLLLGLAAAAIPILSAAAAPATPEEAARLTALFARYVSQPAQGEPSGVSVTPQGDSYAATLDLKRAAAGLEGFGVTVEPVISTTLLTPLPDGTWKVTSVDGPPVTLHLGQQTVTVSSATSRFEGIYDPKIYGFSRSRQDETGYVYAQTAPTLVQSRHVDKVGFDLGGKAAEGGVDVTGHYDLVGTAADMMFKPAAPAASGGNPAVPPPPAPATSITYKVPTGTADIGLDRLHTKDILDLWAFLVAHPNHDSLAAAQDDLKALLRTGLPFAGAVRESASFASPVVTTPVGPVSARSFGGNLDVEGLAATGKASMGLTVADLVVPPGQLPPWSAGLVPTTLDLHLSVDGFHAAEAATEAVNDVDLRKDVVITPEQKAAVSHLFWPGGGTVSLAPSRLATATLDLRMEGKASLGAMPAGQVTVTGTGLDKEIAALQAEAATDPGAGQVLGPLVLAKNLAKPNPDGSLTWVIAFGNGPVTVNGAALQ